MATEYDFIIVGGGTSGCILAERLSADPANRVLLLEAGRPNRNQLLRIPMTARNFWTNPKYLWNYQSEPEPSVNGRRIPVPRGKILGGSGAINGMLYARGHPRDYDQWRQLGNDGWSYEDVLPYYKRVEHDSHGATPYHGEAGPLAISRNVGGNKLTPLFAAAAQDAGIPFNDDQNGAGIRRIRHSRPDHRQGRARQHLFRLPAPGDGAAQPHGRDPRPGNAAS